MFLSFFNRPGHLFPAVLPAILPAALLIGVLSTGACASREPQREGPVRETSPGGNPQETPEYNPAVIPEAAGNTAQPTAQPVFAMYSREQRIPLWETPPAGMEAEEIPVLTITVDLFDPAIPLDRTTGNPEELGRRFRDLFYRGLSPQDYSQEQARVQTIEYRDMGDEVRNNPLMFFSATLNWTYSEQFRTELSTTRLLVISRERSSYTGGAHGNYDKSYYVFDRELGMEIGLPDIIREGSEALLTALINRELRTAQKLNAADSLKRAGFFVDEAELTKNYFLSPRGLGFHWDPYEIAPYVTGYVEILIPYADITELLAPEGRHLIREFR
jgi:hypothetical protein